MILGKHFYYGRFEYPAGGGNWYTGIHIPIITRELFEKTQEQLRKQKKEYKGYGLKEFAFTKLMYCGLCGSGITADEKFKYQKNGNVHRYVYYTCSKSKDRLCKGGYLNEKDLIKQLENIMDKINLDELGIRTKIEEELKRYNRFRAGILGAETEKAPKIKEINIRNYAKYILREGNILEKRELLLTLKSRLVLKDKKVILGE